MTGFSCVLWRLLIIGVSLYLWDPAVQAEQTPVTSTGSIRMLLDSGLLADRFAAEVWLQDMDRRLMHWVQDAHERQQILEAVIQASRAQGLEPEWVLALMEVESGFDRWALSPAGARGLMQVMPFWIKNLGMTETDLLDIESNIQAGCRVLARYLRREHGNLRRALARYNGSLGHSRYPNKVMQRLRRHWQGAR